MLLIFQDDVERVDDSGDVAQDGQEDVDEQVSAASPLEENTEGGEDDGKNYLANVARGERHDAGFV